MAEETKKITITEDERLELQDQIDKDYRKVAESLEERWGGLAAKVLSAGYPEISDVRETAWVAATNGWIGFGFNPTFYKSLDFDGFRFVVCHEAMHLVLNHLFRMEKIIENDYWAGRDMFNIASDCVVNDWLASIAQLKPIKGALRGSDVVGYSCWDRSVDEVYRALRKKLHKGFSYLMGSKAKALWEKSGMGGHENWGDEAEGEKESKMAKVLGGVSLGSQGKLGEFEDKKLQRLDGQDDIREDEHGSSSYGTDRSGSRAVSMTRASLAWERLFLRFIKDDTEETWSRINNKLISVYPEIVLPAMRFEGLRPKILVAVDVSFSIPNSDVQRFLGMVSTIPASVDVVVTAFAGGIARFNPQNPPRSMGVNTNSTYFGPIEKFAKKKMTRYPDGIIVLTDGSAESVNPKYPERWTFVLLDEYNTQSCIPKGAVIEWLPRLSTG